MNSISGVRVAAIGVVDLGVAFVHARGILASKSFEASEVVRSSENQWSI